MTKPQHENIAALNLTRQGYVNYCPKFKILQTNKVVTIKPLFPRYIFILIDQIWSSILGTRGISKILLGDNGPQQLPTSIIDTLKSREVNGLIDLTPMPEDKFAIGAKVKTSEGPLAGLDLIYEGMSSNDRVKVLADLLGRKVVVELAEKSIVAV